MIFGIGTDLVEIARIDAALARHGERFAQRVLSDEEWRLYQQHLNEHPLRATAFLAKRFAAKEAAAKAMGSGFRDGLSLRHIAVVNDEMGRPTLQFSGAAADFIEREGIGASHISLADERHYAIAFVTLMLREA